MNSLRKTLKFPKITNYKFSINGKNGQDKITKPTPRDINPDIIIDPGDRQRPETELPKPGVPPQNPPTENPLPGQPKREGDIALEKY